MVNEKQQKRGRDLEIIRHLLYIDSIKVIANSKDKLQVLEDDFGRICNVICLKINV